MSTLSRLNGYLAPVLDTVIVVMVITATTVLISIGKLDATNGGILLGAALGASSRRPPPRPHASASAEGSSAS